jgi:hypothetical protein
MRSIPFIALGAATTFVTLALSHPQAAPASGAHDATPRASARLDEADLAAVLDARAASSLSLAQRHARLRAVATRPDLRERVDRRLHARLDLEQAEHATDPCWVYVRALDELRGSPAAIDRAAVQRAKAPGLCAGPRAEPRRIVTAAAAPRRSPSRAGSGMPAR